MDAIYRQLVEQNDKLAGAALGKQVQDPASKYYGGVVDESGIARAHHHGTPVYIAAWAAALVNPDSRYYRDGEMAAAVDLAASFLLNRQHADGTVSLGSTNYNSPPDTGFVIGGVAQIYQLLAGQDWAEVQPAADKLKLFLKRTIPAMLTGGCHTPNHRWVLTAALALLYEIFPQAELKERADAWLAEGLDITSDGEWTERSNGIYNAVSDIALYHTARVFKRPELLESVRRNLRMMVYLIHPSGEVVTDYSGRQDFGQTYDMATYYTIYRLMAAHDKDPLFAAMGDYAGSFVKRPEGVNNNGLLHMLLYPEAEAAVRELQRAELPDTYVQVLNGTHPMNEHLSLIDAVGHHLKIQHSSMHLAFGAPVVRIRDKAQSVTIMPRTPSFFSLRHGKARLLGVKLSTSFSPGIVKFDELTAEENVYRLAATMSKGYNGPVPQQHLPLTSEGPVSPWYLLPHQHRPMTHLQTHELQADITRGSSEWTIRIRSDQREDVFAQLTFILGSEGELEGGGLEEAGDGKYSLKSGSAVYAAGDDRIELSAGAYEHLLAELREDAHPSGCKYVHINLVTPFDRTFTVRLL